MLGRNWAGSSKFVLGAAVGVLGLLASACGGGDGAVDVGRLPLRLSFDECGGFTSNDDVATIDCPDGRLRILITKPEQGSIHYVPFRFDPAAKAISVSSRLRLARGVASYGIGCDTSQPGEPATGYAFVLFSPLDAAIVYKLKALSTGEIAFLELAFRQVELHDDAPVHVQAACAPSAGGATVLRFSVDGRRVIDTIDRDGFGPFRASLAFTSALTPAEVEARYEDLRVGPAEGWSRPPITRSPEPLQHHYAILMTDRDGEEVRTVALGDQLYVVVSSPDLPLASEVRFELCVDKAAKPACTRERLEGGSSYFTAWTVDPGEERDRRFRLSVRIAGREVASTAVAHTG